MQFKIIIATLAFVTTSVVAAQAAGPIGPTIIPPFPGNPLPTVRKSNCGAGQFQCCKAAQVSTGQYASSALARLGIATGSVGGLVGLNCFVVTGGSWCYDTPLCCTENSGSVAIACNPLAQNQ